MGDITWDLFVTNNSLLLVKMELDVLPDNLCKIKKT